MSDWVEVSNWEACKAKSEGKEVEAFFPPFGWVEIGNNCEFPLDRKHRIKTPDPARLFGKVIWTRDGKNRFTLNSVYDGEYPLPTAFTGHTRLLTAEEIEQQFDVRG